MFFPTFLSLHRIVNKRTNAIVVDIALSPVPSNNSWKIFTSGGVIFSFLTTRLGSDPPSSFLLFFKYFISLLFDAGLKNGAFTASLSVRPT